jgi:hypothetical protein
VEEISALTASGTTVDEVANQIQKRARLGPELITLVIG